MSQEQLDDAYDWLWDAHVRVSRAMTAMKVGDYEDAQHQVVESINLLDDVQNVLRAEVGPE